MPREDQRTVTITLEAYNTVKAFYEANQDQLRPHKIKSASGVFNALALGMYSDQFQLVLELILKGRRNQLKLQQAKIDAQLEKEGLL